MKLRSNKIINTSFKRAKTPVQDPVLKEPDSEERAAYLWHAKHRRDGEHLTDVAAQHGIDPTTGLRWRKDEAYFGDSRRTRKRKAEELDHKLGQPWRVSDEDLHQLLSDETNPIRDKPYSLQADENRIPLAPRSLQYNLSKREDAHLYIAAYTEEPSSANKRQRISYGEEHDGKEIEGFWDEVFFTDEAHYNPEDDFQKPRILRKKGERLKRGNVRLRKKRRASPLTLHIFAAINWYYKTPLYFYNDEKDMLKPPKPPPKPRKTMYITKEVHAERVKEWEAKKPPPLKVVSQGHHMTQEYYTNQVLPKYIAAVHKARLEDSSKSWKLQEDGDPSHGIKSSYNVAKLSKQENWIDLLVHPAQSPDLNPSEGCWLILKQYTKKRLHLPQEDQKPWDGTKKHLKKILEEEWDRITIEQVRDRIKDMPFRCHELTINGGERMRGEKW